MLHVLSAYYKFCMNALSTYSQDLEEALARYKSVNLVLELLGTNQQFQI
jgi:hypothetical protein